MKRLLITGAGGFIGRNLSEAFKESYELITPSRRELDLGEIGAVREYLKRFSPDILIHCASSSDTNRSPSPKENFLAENLRMFFTLETLRDYYGKMIYFGSGAEFGARHYIPKMREEYFGRHIPEAEDVYGIAKYAIAKYAEKNRSIVNLRLFGVFGKYEMWSRRFISNAVCRALKGLPIVIRKNQGFDYLWVEDLAPITELFFEGETKHNQYNVCTGSVYTLHKLALMVCGALGIKADITVKEDSGDEYSGSNERLVSEFRVSFTDMETAIKKLCVYYEEHIGEIDEKML